MKLWMAAICVTTSLCAQTGARITGRITSSGTPLRGEVLAFVNNGSVRIDRAPTDEQGRFSIDLGPGLALLVAKADGYISEERHLMVRSEAGNPSIQFVLAMASSVSGRVLDENGAGVSGAHVWVGYPGEARSWRFSEEVGGEATDNFGYFHLPSVAQGRPFILHTECEGWLMSSSGTLVSHTREMPGVMLMLGRRGATIRGRVVDQAGNPVAGAELQLRSIPARDEFTVEQRASVAFARATNKAATSARDGSYVFAGVPAGQAVVTARVGNQHATGEGTIVAGREAEITLTVR